MGWKSFFAILFFLLIIGLFFSYFFLPIGGNYFFVKVGNKSIPSYYSSDTQFFSNLRFPDKKISYRIDLSCPLKKKNEMENSFSILENLTILNFYSVDDNEQISISCKPFVRGETENGFFVAGEGGPVNITLTENYGVIEKGEVLLIRESKCPSPNIGLHELLHALGFKHSSNPDSVMYAVSDCSQVITDDIPQEINRLYSVDSLPDLVLENFSVQSQGRYLNVIFNVINQGLTAAGNSSAILYVNGKEAKNIELQSFDVGYGTNVELKNIFIPFGKIQNISLEVVAPFDELNKKNNKLEADVNT